MKALIYGISGQDGAYLAQYLLELGYEVWGASRDAATAQFGRLSKVGVLDRVRLISASLGDFRSVLNSLALAKPDEVYNLAGQSSVSLFRAASRDDGKHQYRGSESSGSDSVFWKGNQAL